MLHTRKQLRRVVTMLLGLLVAGMVGACDSVMGPEYPEIEFRDGAIVENDLMRDGTDEAQPIRKRAGV